MHRKQLAQTLAAVIVATALLGGLAVAVHHDAAGRPAGKVLAGSTSRADRPSPAAGPLPDAPATSPTTGPAANGADTTTSTRPPAASTTIRPAATATTRPGSTATTAGPATATGPAPTRPGTYTYSQTGTNTISPVTAQAALVISQSGGRENWARSDGSTTVMLFDGSGVYIQSLTEPQLGATCTFASPVAWPPWPVAPGKTFSGRATCSGLGNATVAVSGLVGSAGSFPLDGAMVATFVVTKTVVVTVGTTSLTVTQIDSYAPSLRLAVRSEVHSTNPFFTINETSTLVSATPT